ncbi:MAG: PEP-CTERM sorting domain-containing protein [Puniceicoccales bacterium]
MKTKSLFTLSLGAALLLPAASLVAESVTYQFTNTRSEDVYLYFNGDFSFTAGQSVTPTNGMLVSGNGGVANIQIDSVNSGRIGYSIGQTLDDATLGGFNNTSSSDYYKRFDKVELTVNAAGLNGGNADITATDWTSIPVSLSKYSNSSTYTGYTKTYNAFYNSLLESAIASGATPSTPSNPYNGAGFVLGNSGFGVNTSSYSDVVRFIAPSTVAALPAGKTEPYVSFSGYVNTLRQNATTMSMNRTAAGITWTFNNGSISGTESDPTATFSGGSLSTGSNDYTGLTLTIGSDGLESETIYKAPSYASTALEYDAETQTIKLKEQNGETSNAVSISGAGLDGIDLNDPGNPVTAAFMQALNGAVEDFYVGFLLGAWGSITPVDEGSLQGLLGDLNSGQILELGEATGIEYFFDGAQPNDPDYYSVYALVVAENSDNTVYGFPYSDFIQKDGENPLITVANGEIIYINILGDDVVVPEPSTYAMLFGVGVLMVVLYRRRRK